jgi:dGTPase
MDWEKLLSRKLLGEEREIKDVPEGRSQFQRDFDRVVFSSAFRRLQDKTQVFPMPESDFVHTRLTHSLEVSCVGRSLGNLAGAEILKKYSHLKEDFTPFHFGEIVSAACLAHDIGNPPFGHSGEDAIAEYFKRGNGKQFESEIGDEKKWNDFIRFEGNAQGFRIITKLQNPNIRGGLRLTCATLAAFTKYPKESFLPSKQSRKGGKEKIYKKFGFFQAEKDLFLKVAEETGLIKKGKQQEDIWFCRHPLVFLVEAADDICYRVMDLEDGFRLGLLNFNEIESLLIPLVNKDELISYEGRDNNDKIGYLRAKAINSLIYQVTDAFINKEEEILSGSCNDDMLTLIPGGKQLEHIKELSKDRIYSYKSVVEREAAGYEVLGGLLDTFISAVNEFAGKDKPSFRSNNILKLLPKQFLKEGKPHDDLYTRLLNITDFVSGMTDSYAISLFRKIRGINLPA